MIWLRSIVFNLGFYVLTASIAVAALPLLFAPPAALFALLRWWSNGVVHMLWHVCRIRVEVRGREHLPAAACIIAAKHQSTFDTIFWFTLLPEPAYVIKRELLWIPLYGWHAYRSGAIAVDRAGGGAALKRMVREAAARIAAGRHVVIFPEGTRVPPGQHGDWQPGIAALAGVLRVPVVPVATNSGRFWGRRAFRKPPGTIMLEILPPIPPGLPRATFMATLVTRVEAASDALLREAVEKSVGKAS